MLVSACSAVRWCLLGVVLSAASAHAQVLPQASQRPDVPPRHEAVAITLQQFLVRDPAQAPVALDAATPVRPGDLIEYRALYRNQGQIPLQVTARLPIPVTLVYEAGSATQAHQVAQADAQFGSEPLQKAVLRSDGETVLVPVPYADYRLVQWDLGTVLPQAQREVRLRARVTQAPPVVSLQAPALP